MAAPASDGQINVAAGVAATTCQISGMGGTNNFTVPMPTISSARLAQPGAADGLTRINIMLTNCGPTPITSNWVHTFFEPGPTVDVSSGNLIPATGAGTASNIEVALLTSMLSKIHLGAPDKAQGTLPTIIAANTRSGQITFYAEYVAVGGPAGPGTVNTSVVFDLAYN
jgi:major type 1 subunit fimbrin (pilin)